MSISAMDSDGVETCDFDIDVVAGVYPSISVLVFYAGSEEQLEIYTGSPMVGLTLYDGDGYLVGTSMINTVSEPITFRKDELKETTFDLSLLAKNMGGILNESVYRLDSTLSYALASGDTFTVSRSFTLELTKIAY